MRALGADEGGFAPVLSTPTSGNRNFRGTPEPLWRRVGWMPCICRALRRARPAGDGVRIAPASGQVAMMGVLGGIFSLDPADPPTMTRTFAHAARLLDARQGLSVHHLQYPRRHGELPQVLRALLDHQQG
ncbi:MAG: hypothetical protein R3E50_11115 [Halioglobus sp.]